MVSYYIHFLYATHSEVIYANNIEEAMARADLYYDDVSHVEKI